MLKDHKEKVEYACAVMCVMSAIAIGVSSVAISEHHDIAAGVLIFIAQMLLFAASVFQINYKLSSYGETKSSNKE